MKASPRRPAIRRRNPKPAGRRAGPMEFAWTYTGVRVLDLPAALRFDRDGHGMRVRFRFRIRPAAPSSSG